MLHLLLVFSVLSFQAPTPRAVREAWPDGSARAEYEVLDVDGEQMRVGKFREWHSNGQPAAVGAYSRGLRAGEWETWRPNGQKESRGRYASDRRTGKWWFWREDGVENLEETGHWQWFELRSAEGGLCAAGYERDGARHGAWTYHWPDRTTQFAGEYRNGQRRGEWVFFHRDGRPALWLLSGVYDGEARTTLLTVERWIALVKQVGGDERPAPLIDEPKPQDVAKFELSAGDTRPMATLLVEWQDLDTSRPEAVERGGVLSKALGVIASGSHFGWPTGAGEADARLRREVFRSWASVWTLTRDRPGFWLLDVRSRVGDASSDPRVTLSAPALRCEPRPRKTAHLPRDPYALRFARPKDPNAPGGVQLATTQFIADGLAWLAAHQESDGRWTTVRSDACATHGGSPCVMGGRPGEDVGVTSLALLALMGEGNSTSEGPYALHVARGVRWLTTTQGEGELIGSSFVENGKRFVRGDRLIGHSIATLALCEAYALAPSDFVRGAAQRALEVLRHGRNPYGAWRYGVPPNGENDTFVTTWAVAALLAADEAGLKVDRDCFAGALAWIDELTDTETGRIGYDAVGSASARYERENDNFVRDGLETMTAAGLWCRSLLGQDAAQVPILRKHVELLKRHSPQHAHELRRDFLYGFFGASALAAVGGDAQVAWGRALLAQLKSLQRQDLDAKGSWDPSDAWGYAGGRAYATAVNVLALEAPYRRAPPPPAPLAKGRAR